MKRANLLILMHGYALFFVGLHQIVRVSRVPARSDEEPEAIIRHLRIKEPETGIKYNNKSSNAVYFNLMQ